MDDTAPIVENAQPPAYDYTDGASEKAPIAGASANKPQTYQAVTPGPPPAVVVQGQPDGGTIYVHQVPITYMSFGKTPACMQCPYCNTPITTVTIRKHGVLPWLSCAGLALIGCFFGCCLIPFCIDDLQDIHHICPHCGREVGVVSRLG